MMGYVYLGCVPAMETCADAIKQPDQSRLECRAYKHQLLRQFPISKDIPAWYTLKGSQHDFGNYYEVAVKYDDTNEAAITFAYLQYPKRYGVEEQLPTKWDEQAVRELASAPA
jgi:hypothetical protein